MAYDYLFLKGEMAREKHKDHESFQLNIKSILDNKNKSFTFVKIREVDYKVPIANKIFIEGHGRNIGTQHFIDGINSLELIKNIEDYYQHDIDIVINSCYSGCIIDEYYNHTNYRVGTSLTTLSSKNYDTLSNFCRENILSILSSSVDNKFIDNYIGMVLSKEQDFKYLYIWTC